MLMLLLATQFHAVFFGVGIFCKITTITIGVKHSIKGHNIKTYLCEKSGLKEGRGGLGGNFLREYGTHTLVCVYIVCIGE